jgi:protein phosphatase
VEENEQAQPKFTIEIPDFCVVALIGVSGCGKSTFAARHFLPTEILSSDAFRAWVSDDENDQSATTDAFEALYSLASTRLRRRKTVVIDATNVQEEARKRILELAKSYDCHAVAIVINTPESLCVERNQGRTNRNFGANVVYRQARQLRDTLRSLKRERFRNVYVLQPERLEACEITRVPLWTDRRTEMPPFDIIGDIHGCYDELMELLSLLGYTLNAGGVWAHSEGRRALFLGDLVDRGNGSVEVANLVMDMVSAGSALCVPGNHDVKLTELLKTGKGNLNHGRDRSMAQIEALSEKDGELFKSRFITFVDSLVSHLWLDGGQLCVAHAGMTEAYMGRASGRVRSFALYGQTTGEIDEYGLPVRYPWAMEYRGTTTIAYGHTPVLEAEWLNNTINLDTGCVFGGKLSALRYPEREIVQIPARAVYAESLRPLKEEESATIPMQWVHDELLSAQDVLEKRFISTRICGNISVPVENRNAAIETMSRFAVEPRWLIYLPPTMSPCETTKEGIYLEHPTGAFSYYRKAGVEQVVCQRKHMGSRAVFVVCRGEETARKRFGATNGDIGKCYTRTGRQFFDAPELHNGLVQEVQKALTQAGFWEEFDTDWVCFDAELMPWSAKAQGLLKEQYAPVGVAGQIALREAVTTLEKAQARNPALTPLYERLQQRQADIDAYVEAYCRYCWATPTLSDYRIAPFHLLATEGRTHLDRPHTWHIETLARLAQESEVLMPTEMLEVNLNDSQSEEAGVQWWLEMTEAGGEGMVVKPLDFIVKAERGVLQPAVKVRGREYLRIIYGPAYTEPENLSRLRSRGLGAKRHLAMREFALGVEGLERFVKQEPLRKVHECVFGVLAFESEPVDPRL